MGQEADRRVGNPVPKELNCILNKNHLVCAVASLKGLYSYIKDVLAFSTDVTIKLKCILTLSRKRGRENLKTFQIFVQTP